MQLLIALAPKPPFELVWIGGPDRWQPPIVVGRGHAVAFPLTNEAVLADEGFGDRLPARREEAIDAVVVLEAVTALAANHMAGPVVVDLGGALRARELWEPHVVHVFRSTIRK